MGVSVELRQTDGSITPQGGIDDSAKSFNTALEEGQEQARDLTIVLDDWNYSVVKATGDTVIRNVSAHGPVTYGGYKILGDAGAFTMSIYDNTAASGQLLEPTGISVGAAAEKVYAKGLRCGNGITVNLSGDPTDGLILILWK